MAQALWMMGIEPLRDGMGRIDGLRLVPSIELGRPRINILVQVSGQLRDMAGSRLQMITDAVKLAAEATDDSYPNYVAEGTLEQERALTTNGLSPIRARELASMRVFGPLNNGYSTGIMGYIEHSGQWNDEAEIAQGYLNNMGAAYGDEASWGAYEKELLPAALQGTDVMVQPRQSNTWGPVSLDHVYEFTGGLSLAVKSVTGKEPDSYMADYRNTHNRHLQDTKEAIAVENRATILLMQDGTRYVVGDGMAELDERLPDELFFRTHKSYIVNLNLIESIQPYGRWTYVVKLRGLRDDALITHERFEELQKRSA